MNTFEIYSKATEGFSNGFGIDEYKKGQTVYFWYKSVPAAELELKSGKVVEIEKAKNAEGRDTIRRVGVEIEGTNIIRGFGTISQIKNWIFKKDKVEKPAPEKKASAKKAPEKKEAAPVIEIENGEFVWVEKAMTAKSKAIKKHLAEGWEFIESVWSKEKNCYLGKLQRSAS